MTGTPRLLVSVRSAAEGAAALAGGADLIDAKDPAAGPLGAVSLETLRDIVATVNGVRPVTAAMGDAIDAAAAERCASALVRAGAALVKVGFAGVATREAIDPLVAAAARGAGQRRVIAVAYADYQRAGTVAPHVILDVAIGARLAGMLIDTADKTGAGLTALVAPETLAGWADVAHRAGLLLALAGRLEPCDLPGLRRTGADIVGVRGAACDAGRLGRVSAERVSDLRAQCLAGDPSDYVASPSALTLPPT